MLIEVLLVFAAVSRLRNVGLVDGDLFGDVFCMIRLNSVGVVDFTDKIYGDLWLVLNFLILEMRMFERRTDRFVVLLLQFLQHWGYVANGFKNRRVSLKSR